MLHELQVQSIHVTQIHTHPNNNRKERKRKDKNYPTTKECM